MTHEIRVRDAQLFGGLVVPRVEPGFRASGSDLVEFLKSRLRDRGDGDAPIYSVYVPDAAGQNNLLVCFSYDLVSEIPFGDVFTVVQRGVYARFEPNGVYSDRVEDVWAQAQLEVDLGTITRARGAEIEICHPNGDFELFLSIEG